MTNSSSSSLSDTISSPIVHVILNIISLITTTIGILVSFGMLGGILFRKKTFHDVQLLLCTNNYTMVFLLGIFALINNLSTLRGDFGLLMIDEETLGCRIEGYVLFSFASAVYLACVLQAVFRLYRIVYPTVIRLLEVRTYSIIIPLMWIASFVLVSPLYIWHGQKYIPGDFICRVSKDDGLSIAYSTLIIYGIPFTSLAFIYFQVHRFLLRQAMLTSLNMARGSRRRQRDVLVFRRIVIIVTLLGSYGTPNSVMLIMFAITHEFVPSFYRILDLSFAACVLTLSVTLFYVTPQLRKEFKTFRQTIGLAPIATRNLQLKQRTLNRNQLRTIIRVL